MLAEWGAFGVFLAVIRRIPVSERLAWLFVAIASAFQVIGASLEDAARLMQTAGDPLTQTVAAFIAAVISVATISRSGGNVVARGGRLAQGILDIALISASALLISTAHPFQAATIAGVTLRGLSAIIADSLLLIALTWVVLSNPRLVRLVRGYIGLSLICRLSGIGVLWVAEHGSQDVIASVMAAPFDTLRWGILALGAAAYLFDPLIARQMAAARHQRLFDVTTALPWAAAMTALAASALVGRLLTEPLLALAVTGGMREIVTARNRRMQREYMEKTVFDERQGRLNDQRVAQYQIDRLARLIHDQAAPIQGLWHIQGTLLRAQQRTLSDRVSTHLEHLQILADQLRSLLKGHARSTELRRCRVDVLPIIRAAIDAARERADLANVDLTTSVASQTVVVLADPTAFRRILDNLLTNALDATPSTGLVVVELWDDRAFPDFLTITVRDSGKGLSEEQQARIFEPVPQELRGPGLGLGLVIVRDLVTGMDGACGVISTLGAGSAFWVRLPRLESGPEAKR
jgi:signal transduction histidine kinase